MNRRLFWIVFSGILILVFSICTATFIIKPKRPINHSDNNRQLTNNLSTNNSESYQKETFDYKSTISNQERISPNCNLSVETYYKKCGHTIIQNKTVPIDLVNLTKEQLELAYKDYVIVAFSSSKIKLTSIINEKCHQHYVLKVKDGRITVFYQNPIDNIAIKKETNILIERLPEDDRKRLEKGIEINSDEELAYFLEDFGS